MLGRALPVAIAGLLSACALLLEGCAKDTVEADKISAAVCGNGVRETGEACDIDSPGCSNCQVTANWTCDDTTCRAICGDGVVGTGPDCLDPQRDTECDMTGWWAARGLDWSRDATVGSLQAQNGYLLLHLQQTGDDFAVTDMLDCSLIVLGAATVEFSPATQAALLYINRMDGDLDPGDAGATHPARRGTSKASEGGCAVTMERHYIQRGLDDSWIPADFTTHTAFTDMPALPFVADAVNGSEWPAGATDPENDGVPGVAFQVTGIVSGTRNSVQRQWREYATDPGQPVPARALTVQVTGDYDLQEKVLRVQCGTPCPLLASGSNTANDIRPYLLLRFLGRTLSSPAVSAVITRQPREDLTADLATCAKVRTLLPPVSAVPEKG